MEGIQGKRKKGLITRTWERCKSIGRGRRSSNSTSSSNNKATRHQLSMITRRKSWPSLGVDATPEEEKRSSKRRVAPEGCFSVYVGPQKQRFVIKTEYANHPLFKMLLEEAESEYGYNSQGPLALPCNVDIFYKVLMEMDEENSEEIGPGCGFVKRMNGSYQLLSPSRMIAINHF